jgi:ferrous iron transport protein A
MNLSELGVGQKALILQAPVELPVKLFEMGCLPGEEVELVFAAPFRDPLCFRVQGTLVSMRRDLAELIPITEPHVG